MSGDESVEAAAAAAKAPLTDPRDEPGYVEILGGEEPPDEWLNLGSRRERVSSSSSDGSGFQYIAGNNQPHQQESGAVDEVRQIISFYQNLKIRITKVNSSLLSKVNIYF